MNTTTTKASILVWTVVASLLVVAALIAGYTMFFSHRTSQREQACHRARQVKAADSSEHQLAIDEALCTGIAP